MRGEILPMDRALVKKDSLPDGGLRQIGRFGRILKHPGFDSGLIRGGEIGKLDVYSGG